LLYLSLPIRPSLCDRSSPSNDEPRAMPHPPLPLVTAIPLFLPVRPFLSSHPFPSGGELSPHCLFPDTQRHTGESVMMVITWRRSLVPLVASSTMVGDPNSKPLGLVTPTRYLYKVSMVSPPAAAS
jgi:hypothetical protein